MLPWQHGLRWTSRVSADQMAPRSHLSADFSNTSAVPPGQSGKAFHVTWPLFLLIFPLYFNQVLPSRDIERNYDAPFDGFSSFIWSSFSISFFYFRVDSSFLIFSSSSDSVSWRSRSTAFRCRPPSPEVPKFLFSVFFWWVWSFSVFQFAHNGPITTVEMRPRCERGQHQFLPEIRPIFGVPKWFQQWSKRGQKANRPTMTETMFISTNNIVFHKSSSASIGVPRIFAFLGAKKKTTKKSSSVRPSNWPHIIGSRFFIR